MNVPAGALVRTTCPYCGVGCGLAVTRGDARRAEVRGDAAHPANFGRLCSKGAALGETLGLDGRALGPVIGGRRATWDEALTAVADGFTRIIAEHGPDAVAFYVSGQLLTEDYYVANKLMKGFIGSANIDTNSRLCMASAVAGYKRAFGADAVPNVYEDLEAAELIVLVGSNAAWCHPVLFRRIAEAKERNAGLSVVVIDPRRTATCDIADLFLPIRPGTDVMLLNGLLNYLRREDALDWEFLDAHTEGFGAAMRAAKETAPSIPAVAAACGIAEAGITELYRRFAQTERVVTLFSQGVNQSTSGTDKVNAIINVHLATGRIGKPGAGPFSLTGQPNAMGGREVGGLANQLAAHMEFTPENVDRVGRFWRAQRLAERPGLKAVELFEAVAAGSVRAVWIMSTNPVVSMPDADRVRRGLDRCELVVVSDCVERTDTTACADILLPAASWGEKSGTVTNSERRISRQRAFLDAPGDSRPDWWIVTQVARRMGFADAFPYEHPAEIFREHAALSAFENDGTRAFDIGALAAVTDAEYEALEPVQWPVRVAEGPVRNAGREDGRDYGRDDGRDAAAVAAGRPLLQEGGRLFADGRFFTPTGKARFVAVEPRGAAALATRAFPLVLNTGRTRDQWHTMTRTGYCARLTGHQPEPFVHVHPSDAGRAGLTSGDLARVEGPRARIVARVEITSDVQPGHIFAPMHWSDRFTTAGRVGALLEAHTDPISGQPELKHAPVRLGRYSPAWYGFALTRESFEFVDCTYVAAAKGDAHWRYELAGDALPGSWSEWARPLLGEPADRIELLDDSGGRYRGACVRDGRLAACVFVNRSRALPPRGWLASLFAADALDDAARLGLLAGRTAGASDNGPVVCSCFAVGRSALLRTIRAQALVSPADIGRALGAGTNCGSCLPELKSLLVEAAG